MSSATGSESAAQSGAHLKRALGLWDLVFYGIILIQPTAPMPPYGVVSQAARGHVVTTVLLAMVAMLFTAISYGRMARAYPSAGSAYTYVGREIHSGLGFLTGWSLAMDYILNPIICTIWCSKAALNLVPEIPYVAWAVFFALLFTLLNLRGIRATARTNEVLVLTMCVVIVYFFIAAVRFIMHQHGVSFTQPFYDPSTFSLGRISTGTSVAVLTYIGFDGISTLSEEAHNPRRNIMLATVLTCLITGVLASSEVYAAQLVWPNYKTYPDVDTAFVYVAGRAGGAVLFQVVNLTLLVATIGSGMGSQLGAARLLYGMGRDNTIPRGFFGAIEPKHGIPRNNVLFVGALALIGAFTMTYGLGAELLNFGAIIGFMGVNAAAFIHYFVRSKRKTLGMFLPPLLGFFFCLYIWKSLHHQALIAGGIWLSIGILYAAVKTRGFREAIVFSDPPPDEA
ncbi:MAG TPA: APC family permease [Bryobacteraceae bacterium]|nr:APC family permease [Bryobacteraceae bacterium]